MARVIFAIPGDLAARTGGYGYDRRVMAALSEFGFDVVHLALPKNFPDPTPGEVAEAVEAMRAAAARPGDLLLIDGLAYGALPAVAIGELSAPIVALCHHPLGLETGLTAARQKQLYASERAALALASQVIATSETTGALLVEDFDVDQRKLTIALPGTDAAKRAQGSGGTPALLAIGSIIPRKAFDVLVEALAGLADLDWRLRLVGGTQHAPGTVAALKAQIASCGLGQRIEICGEMFGADLAAAFATSNVFVSASLYEGYGMALAEALSRGLPIVTTTGGAAAQTVPDAAALKIPPGDAPALRQALRKVLTGAALRQTLSDASWRAGQNLPRWRDTAQKIAGALRIAQRA